MNDICDDKTVRTALTRTIGKESNLQVEDLDFWMSLEMSFTESEQEGANNTGTSEYQSVVNKSWWWICSNFEEKDYAIELQNSEIYRWEGSESLDIVFFLGALDILFWAN